MTTPKAPYAKLAKACLVATVAAGVFAAGATFAANAADASGVKLKVTGVAVLDEMQEDKSKVKYLPPDTRVVVPSTRHFVLFRVEYDVPTNMNARIFLGENGNTARLGLDFCTGASDLYKGTGTVAKPLGLDSDVYDKGVLLKSVRLSAEIEGNDDEESKSVYVGDASVNVLFAKDGGKKSDGFTVFEPLPPHPAVSTSLLPGWTEDLQAACAQAKKEGKLVYACFSGSDWCYWCKKLEKEVLSDPLFVANVMDDYVLVFIDSPENQALLSDHAKAENEKLTKKYGIRGFPTALILDGDGKKVGETGYRQGGAAEYVKHLKSFRKK